MNPIIRDILKLFVLGLSSSIVYEIVARFGVSTHQLYMLGMVMGVLLCFILNVLSSLTTNISIIIKLTTANYEDFGKFLKGLGCNANFIPNEKGDDKNE